MASVFSQNRKPKNRVDREIPVSKILEVRAVTQLQG